MTAHDRCRVAPFGNLRVKGWLAPHRSLSQLPHVLHRLSMPRHPPKTLDYLGPVLQTPNEKPKKGSHLARESISALARYLNQNQKGKIRPLVKEPPEPHSEAPRQFSCSINAGVCLTLSTALSSPRPKSKATSEPRLRCSP